MVSVNGRRLGSLLRLREMAQQAGTDVVAGTRLWGVEGRKGVPVYYNTLHVLNWMRELTKGGGKLSYWPASGAEHGDRTRKSYRTPGKNALENFLDSAQGKAQG